MHTAVDHTGLLYTLLYMELLLTFILSLPKLKKNNFRGDQIQWSDFEISSNTPVISVSFYATSKFSQFTQHLW